PAARTHWHCSAKRSVEGGGGRGARGGREVGARRTAVGCQDAFQDDCGWIEPAAGRALAQYGGRMGSSSAGGAVGAVFPFGGRMARPGGVRGRATPSPSRSSARWNSPVSSLVVRRRSPIT